MTDAAPPAALPPELPPLRWGVLSTATIARKSLIPAIRAARNAELVAIASRDLSRAADAAASISPLRVYGRYEALLSDPAVDAVYIPLPNALHAEWTIRAAEYGKHVLCEKPLGMTVDEVGRMIAACAGAGVQLMEAFMYRFHPQLAWVQEQIAAGLIGSVALVRAGFAIDLRAHPENIRLRAALAGGSLMDVGCYPLNLARVILGGKPTGVQARVDVPPGSEVERAVGALLDYGTGRMALLDCSFAQAPHQFAEIVGERGRIVLPRPFNPASEALVRVETDTEMRERRFPAANPYQLEVEAFSASVRNGTPVPLPPEDALEQAAVVERIYQAGGYRWPRG